MNSQEKAKLNEVLELLKEAENAISDPVNPKINLGYARMQDASKKLSNLLKKS